LENCLNTTRIVIEGKRATINNRIDIILTQQEMTTNEPWNRIIELDAKGEPTGCFICNKPCYVGLSLPEHDSSSGTFFYVCEEHQTDSDILRNNDLNGILTYITRYQNRLSEARLRSLK
jgi:hypothetical protein